MTDATQQTVTCEACGHTFTLDEGVRNRPAGNDVSEVGIVCPNCNEWTHAYFETPDVAAARERMQAALQRFQAAPAADRDKRWQQLKVQQAAYQRVFDSMQKRWRQKRNVKKRAD